MLQLTGLVDADQCLTCDRAEDIIAAIQEEMNGQVYAECSLKRSKQVTSLKSLYASVSVGNDRP